MPSDSTSRGLPLGGGGVLEMSTLRPSRRAARLSALPPAQRPSPGSSLTILTAASSDVTVSRACRGGGGRSRMRRGRGRGWIPRQGAEPAPSSLFSRPTSRRAHLVDVAIGPGPHALQQLKAVPRVLQRHIPQQRHGPAPGGPPRAAEPRSRGAGAGRRGAGLGGTARAGACGSEAAWAGPRPGAGPRGCPCDPPGGGARGTGPQRGGEAPRLFRQPPVPAFCR